MRLPELRVVRCATHFPIEIRIAVLIIPEHIPGPMGAAPPEAIDPSVSRLSQGV